MSMAGIFFVFNVMWDLSLQHTGSLVVAHRLQSARVQELWRTGLVALWHLIWNVGSESNKGLLHCRQILYQLDY